MSGPPLPPDTLRAPNALAADQSISSANGYEFVMKSDGNAVINWRFGTASTQIWQTGTVGDAGTRITMEPGGNVALSGPTGDVKWQTGTTGNDGASLVMQPDGNLVVRQDTVTGPQTVWSSNSAPVVPVVPVDRTAAGCPEGADRSLCERSVAAASSDTAARAIKYAMNQLGSPYCSGCSSRLGFGPQHAFDCSGLMLRSYSEAGVDLGAQTSGSIVTGGGIRRQIAVGAAKPGDIVGYSGHVAMLLADGLIVEATKPGTPVRIASFAGRGLSRAVTIAA